MIKVVVNTHVAYSKPYAKFLDSVQRNKDATSIYNRLIVIVNGCEHESIEKDDNGVLTVRTPLNTWEYSAFVVLEKHKTHPDVQSEYYMLLHDTCLLGRIFFDKLSSHEKTLKNNKYGIMRYPLPSSNIVIIHHELVHSFASAVANIKTKNDGCLIEQGRTLPDGTKSFYQTKMPTSVLGNRRELRPIDIYETGYPRTPFYYPAFDVMKYILWGRNGDFTNNVCNNEPSRR